MRISVFLAVLALFCHPAIAQSPARISGTVIHSETREPVVAANVVIVGTPLGAATDSEGRFRINRVPAGQYTLKITALGYETHEKSVQVTAGQTISVVIELSPSVLLFPPVTVTESGFRPAEAYNVKVLHDADVRPAVSAELVASMPGVYMQRVGSWGSKPVIRGYRDEQVVVFVDGVRINRAGPAKMDAALATVPAEQIDKIEILRGPRAAVYGPGAIGGMINVVTQKAPVPNAEGVAYHGFVRGAAASTARQSALTTGLSATTQKLNLTLRFGQTNQSDYKTPEGVVPNTGFRERFADASLRYQFSSNHRLRMTGQIYRLMDAGFPALAADVPDDDRDILAVYYDWQRPGKKLFKMHLSASYLRMYHHMIVNAVDNTMMKVDADVKATSRTYAAKWRGSVLWHPGWSILFGVDFYRWNGDASRQRTMLTKMTGETMTPDEETLWPGVFINDFGLFAQNTFRLGERTQLEAGLRLDRIVASGELPQNSVIQKAPDFSKSQVSGNLILSYRPSHGLYVSLALGHAFRAPDPTELYIALPLPVASGMPPLGFFVGNPDLNLEKSWQLELGFGGKSGGVEWSTNLYYNRIDDLILALVNGDSLNNLPVYQYTNYPEAMILGGEASLKWRLHRHWTLENQLSFTYGETRARLLTIPEGEPLPEIPPLEWSSTLTFSPVPPFSAQIRGRFVASQRRAADYTREQPTDGFRIFDVQMAYRPTGNLTLVAGVRNLLNEAYSEHLNQLGRGRSVAIQRNLTRILNPGRDVFLSMQWTF